MRITKTHLVALVNQLNKLTGAKLTPYVTDEKGRIVYDTEKRATVNPGCFILSSGYGGYGIGKMNKHGGESHAIYHGYLPAREAYAMISAYVAALEDLKHGRITLA